MLKASPPTLFMLLLRKIFLISVPAPTTTLKSVFELRRQTTNLAKSRSDRFVFVWLREFDVWIWLRSDLFPGVVETAEVPPSTYRGGACPGRGVSGAGRGGVTTYRRQVWPCSRWFLTEAAAGSIRKKRNSVEKQAPDSRLQAQTAGSLCFWNHRICSVFVVSTFIWKMSQVSKEEFRF